MLRNFSFELIDGTKMNAVWREIKPEPDYGIKRDVHLIKIERLSDGKIFTEDVINRYEGYPNRDLIGELEEEIFQKYFWW